MTLEEEKALFAKLLLKYPDDPFKAACELHPHNINRALWIAHNWPSDVEVIEVKTKALENEGELAFLPSKADLARAIWGKLNNPHLLAEDFAKLGKLYADVRGFIEKPNNNTTVNVNQNRVMVVKDLGTDEDWEAKAMKQQRELLNVSTSKH